MLEPSLRGSGVVVISPSMSFGILTHFCKGLATAAGSTRGWARGARTFNFNLQGAKAWGKERCWEPQRVFLWEAALAKVQMCTSVPQWDAVGIREDAVLVLGSREVSPGAGGLREATTDITQQHCFDRGKGSSRDRF